MNRTFSVISSLVIFFIIASLTSVAAHADSGYIYSPQCATSGTHRGKLTFRISNTNSYAKYFQVTVGPHGDNYVYVGGNSTRYFTLQGIPDGVHTARLKYNNTTLATRYSLSFSCAANDVGYDWASIGTAACNSSGTHRGRLQFTFRNNHSSGRYYRVTVGPHGDNYVYVGAYSTRYFTLHGIPAGVHTARAYYGNALMATKTNLNFPCHATGIGSDTATIGSAVCAVTGGLHRGDLLFTITNRHSTNRTYRVTVGPHGDNHVVVGANRTRYFTLRGIPVGIHTARVYYGNAVMATKTSINFNACAGHYDDIGQTACHNCYEPQHSPSLIHALNNNSAIELDFWDTSLGQANPGNWWATHSPLHAHQNNCGGDRTLRACLQDVKNWSDANRNAEVLTVYLDKKQSWGSYASGRSPRHLDDLITSIFPLSRLYRPSELKGGWTSVREGAMRNNWKTAGELRGKIIFVLTGGQAIPKRHNQTQHSYLHNRGHAAVMFVAVDLDEARDYNSTPEHFTDLSASFLVFYNLKDVNFNQSWQNQIRARNYVTRMWWSGGSDAGRSFCSYVNKGITQPAFYDYWDTHYIQRVNMLDTRNPCRLL